MRAILLRTSRCCTGLAVILTLAISCFAPAGVAWAATLSPNQATEPFGLTTSPLSDGELKKKWLDLERKLDDEGVQLALCDGDRSGCVSAAASQFLAIVDSARVRDGRARIGEINRAINLAIRPMSDLVQYGEPDVWSPPLATLHSGAGDCEDYAIAKYVALREVGIPDEDLRILIVRNTLRSENHAVVAARFDVHWLLLDNHQMAMIEDISAKYYRPLFLLGRTVTLKYDNDSSVSDARVSPGSTFRRRRAYGIDHR